MEQNVTEGFDQKTALEHEKVRTSFELERTKSVMQTIIYATAVVGATLSIFFGARSCTTVLSTPELAQAIEQCNIVTVNGPRTEEMADDGKTVAKKIYAPLTPEMNATLQACYEQVSRSVGAKPVLSQLKVPTTETK